jgi:NADPH:quinone reductase-like Zn-dependent oxidoreductase
MKAIRMHGRGGPEQLVYEDAPQPRPGPGEVLVRVCATGVIWTELTWEDTYQTSDGKVRVLPIPGHDLSGVVEEIGPGVTTLMRGDEVYALTAFDRDGAEAEYAIALPHELAPKPRSLDYVQAATVPLSALTAWQALFDHASLSAGQTILIHGAAGGVGVLPSSLHAGLVRMLSRLLPRPTATSYASWEPMRLSTILPHLLRRWFMMRMSSSTLLAVIPWNVPGRW